MGKRGPKAGSVKGYTRTDRLAYRKSVEIRGTIGVVDDLYMQIDEALEERNWNWVTLAKKIPCSRSYLVKAAGQDFMSDQLFSRLCQIFGWERADVLRRT